MIVEIRTKFTFIFMRYLKEIGSVVLQKTHKMPNTIAMIEH